MLSSAATPGETHLLSTALLAHLPYVPRVPAAGCCLWLGLRAWKKHKDLQKGLDKELANEAMDPSTMTNDVLDKGPSVPDFNSGQLVGEEEVLAAGLPACQRLLAG